MLESSHTISGWDIKNKLIKSNENDYFYPRNTTGSIIISDYKTKKKKIGDSKDLIEGTILLENMDSLM